MIATSVLVDQLRQLLGPTGWLEGVDSVHHLVDFRGDFRGEALGVAKPGSTAEVSEVVRICASAGVAVLAQGGNTGLSGGSIPSGGGPTVVLSLTRMRAIEEIDADGATITAQAGVTVQELQEAAAGVDRLFAPDWGARGSATLGGAIATNGGGINVLRYGNTREQVLGVEVVLADGRVWNGLRALPKDNSGYDLKHLFIASEGTLGIVTRAVVRLHPRPAAHRTAFVSLTDIDRLNEWFGLAQSHRPGALSAFELIPEIGVGRVIERYAVQRPLSTVSEWYVLLRLSGGVDVGEDLLDLLQAGTDAGLIGDAVVAESTAQEENLWMLRDELPPPRIFGGYLLKYDLAVPSSRISEFHAEVRTLIESIVPGAMPYVFGHVGDGNLHLTVWPASSPDGLLEKRSGALMAAIDELTWAYRGTISAEHGLGQELRDRIVGQKPPIELELMRRIKDAFDPQGVLNPGKVLPDVAAGSDQPMSPDRSDPADQKRA